MKEENSFSYGSSFLMLEPPAPEKLTPHVTKCTDYWMRSYLQKFIIKKLLFSIYLCVSFLKYVIFVLRNSPIRIYQAYQRIVMLSSKAYIFNIVTEDSGLMVILFYLYTLFIEHFLWDTLICWHAQVGVLVDFVSSVFEIRSISDRFNFCWNIYISKPWWI